MEGTTQWLAHRREGRDFAATTNVKTDLQFIDIET